MAEESGKYYWLKLDRGFFKRHDMEIIEAMPNGKDYILFYVKLLCESVDHEGKLRFSDTIPYNADMLATITRTNVDIVRSAIKIFTELGMMEIMDDGTYYMRAVKKMLGCETKWAQKKREYREQLKAVQGADEVLSIEDGSGTGEDTERTMSSDCPTDVRGMSDKSKSKRIEKEIELERNSHTDVEIYSQNNNSKARNNEEITRDDAWKNSTTVRRAVAQRIVDRMAEEGLEHVKYPVLYDRVLAAMEAGLTPERILDKARSGDYIDFNLWIERSRREPCEAGP